MVVGDELAHHGDHLGDVFGCQGFDVRWADAQRLVRLGERLGRLGDDLRRCDVSLVGRGDDLVLDIGDVAHIGDLVAEPLQVATHHVEDHGVTAMAEVWTRLHRGSAHIDPHLAGVARLKRLESSPQRVVDAHGGDGTAGHRPPDRW